MATGEQLPPLEGDVKMYLTSQGVDVKISDGLLAMENGLENIALISLFTEEGYALNVLARNGAEFVGSSFLKETRKTITRNQIKIVEDAAVRAFDWAVRDGLIKRAAANLAYYNSRGYELVVVITPPTGENQKLIFNKNGENWVYQQSRTEGEGTL